MFITKEMLREQQSYSEGILEEFFTHCKLSILVDDLQDDESRRFALRIARIKVQQMQTQMQALLERCDLQREQIEKEEQG